jgi:tetratricopeptide (TPR) repeat protein
MKTKRWHIFLIGLCLVCSTGGQAQGGLSAQVQKLWELADSLKDEKAFFEAQDVLDQALNLQKQTSSYSLKDLGFTHLLKGRIYLLTDVCALGEPHLAQAIEIFTELDSADLLYRSLSRMAELHKTLGDYETSTFYYQQIIDLAPDYWGEKSSKTGVAYGNIGFNYFYLEDYETTRAYIEKYQQLLTAALPANNLSLAKCYLNCGGIYWQMGEMDQAESFYLKCLQIYQNLLEENDKRFLDLYNNLGGLSMDRQDTLQALDFYRKVLNVERIINGIPQDSLSSFSDDSQMAMEYYQKTLQRRAKAYGSRHPSTLGCYLYIGDAQLQQGLTGKALDSYRSIITGLRFRPDSSNQVFLQIDDEPLLLKAITGEARVFKTMYGQNDDISDLERSFLAYMDAAKLINQIRRGYKTESSYLFWTQNLRPIYDEAIAVSYDLYQQTGADRFLDSAFFLAEKSRAFGLQLALRDQKAIAFSQIPESLIMLEKEMKEELNSYHRAIIQEKAKTSKINQEKLILLKDARLALERKYRALIQQLEKEYPSYYKLKYTAPPAPIKQIQTILASQKAIMIEFVWTPENVYGFLSLREISNLLNLAPPQN